jgi:aminopeptidase N
MPRTAANLETHTVTTAPPRRLYLVLALLLGAAATAVQAGPPHYAADRPLDMQHIRLDLTADLAARRVDAVATLRMTALRPVESVRLDAVDFETHGVTCRLADRPAAPAHFADDGQSIEVDLPQALTRGDALTVVVDYTVRQPRAGLHFVGPTAADPNVPYQLWSLGEASDNRYWIPCFDHPGQRQTSELVVTVDDEYQVLSNGRLVEKTAAAQAGRTVHHWLQDKSHAAYLISLVVGRFDVREERWHDVPLSYWVPEGRAADIAPTFGRTPAMLEFFSERIGVPYPWDKYAQVCCYGAMGGMENTSAMTAAVGYLISEPGGDSGVDGFLAHELAHQWFGDLVTCREWAHLWLNEGFASYCEVLWAGERGGADEAAYALFEQAQQALAADRTRPIVDRDYDDPGQLFDGRAYAKGSWVVHMLRARLGDEAFWRVIQRYCTVYALTEVETVDLRRLAEQETGRSLERFFYDWTERPGHPVLDVALQWNEEERTAEIDIRQTPCTPPSGGAAPEPFYFPLELELRCGDDGPPVRLTRSITRNEERIVVPLRQRPTMFRVDPGHVVLAELRETKPRDLWLVQLARDPDPIGRIYAARALAVGPPVSSAEVPTAIGYRPVGKRTPPAVTEALAAVLRNDPFWGVRREVAKLLGEIGGDAARAALTAGAQDAHAKVREACAAALAQMLETQPAEAEPENEP